MSTKTNHRDRNAVVIGSGLGGLSCGAFLARDGWTVTVLEQHDKLGGYATSFKQGDFKFDVSLHAMPFGQNALYRMMKDLGVTETVDFVPLPELHRVITPKYDLTFPNGNPEGYIKILEAEFPAEASGIRTFVEGMVNVAWEAEKLHGNDEKYILPLFPFQYRNMWKTRGLTLEQMLDRHVSSPELKALLSTLWCYYGLPPSKMSGFYFSVATGDYLRSGAHYVKNRSQDLSNCLVDIIRKAGGKVLLNTKAERIHLEGQHAVGVDDDKGTLYGADLIVSNASAGATFNKLINGQKLPMWPQFKLERYRRKLDRYNPSISSFVLWLGLDEDITDRIEDAEVFLLPDHDTEAHYRASLAGDPEESTLSVTIYDNMYEGYSPPGKSTMSIVFLCSHEAWKPYEEGYWNGGRDIYRDKKSQVAEAVVDRVERELIPGLRDMIEESDAGTPLTNIRFTGNCGGAIYGYEQAMNNTFINRIDNRTPIPNLYLASAWSSPGGGYTGALRSGQKAWRAITKDFN